MIALPSSGPDLDRSEKLRLLESAEIVLVSACLLGVACRYDGREKGFARLRELLATKSVIPICPEASAGLGIPRPKVELESGDGDAVWSGLARAVTVEGREDRSDAFKLGARIALEAVERFGVKIAILKEKSPSCGSREVYVSGEVRRGQGITSALLRSAGLVILSEEEL